MLAIKDSEKCQVCAGSGNNFLETLCSFCDEGLSTNYGAAIMKYHVCYCALNDAKICPICKIECHHKPKLLIKRPNEIHNETN